ncbi:expressed unknown protein [Ectocarpus siliculosus]|uniref:Uncharacterized protein n=1 Tax=Ectocarpus siliculosus TaxID=2880 RepID=D8LKC8_ECTSI|nr:expressed unknown protein [Ectocarpus siliculosus]|eukprot:CBN76073.1 expressed unknown protein [Ectocarpus siliculosus]
MTMHPPARPPLGPASATATKPRLAEWVKVEGEDDDSDVDTANSLRGGGSGGSAPSSTGSKLSCATSPAAAAAAAAAAAVAAGVFPAGAGTTPPEAKGSEDLGGGRQTPAKGDGERVFTEAEVGGGPKGGVVEAEAREGGGGTAPAAAAPATAAVASRKLADWIKDGGADDSEAETSTSGCLSLSLMVGGVWIVACPRSREKTKNLSSRNLVLFSLVMVWTGNRV